MTCSIIHLLLCEHIMTIFACQESFLSLSLSFCMAIYITNIITIKFILNLTIFGVYDYSQNKINININCIIKVITILIIFNII